MRIRSFKFAYILVACAATASAQRLDRSVRPVPPPATVIRAPRVSVDSLPNGLRFFVVEDHSIPVVAVRAVVAADSSNDPAGKDGLARVMLDAMREGTTSRGADQLAEAAAAIGTTVLPTGFTTTTASFAPALSLMSDMLMHPSFDSAGVERRKAQQLARARNLAQSPITGGRRLFYLNVDGAEDPMTRALGANVAAVASITRSDVAGLYARLVGPRSTSLIVAGDVTPQVARAEIERRFAGWTGNAAPSRTAVMPPPSRPTTIYLLDSPGPNAYVALGRPGPVRASDDAVAADVMATILSTRLQSELRDKHAFMYQGASGFLWRANPQPSVFVGSTIVATAKVDSALVAWLALFSEAPTAAEFTAGTQRAAGVLANHLDGADSLATLVADMVRDDLPLDHITRYSRRLTTLTAGDLAAALRTYVDPSHLVIIVSGDRKTIEPALRAANIAPVVVVDAAGKPIS